MNTGTGDKDKGIAMLVASVDKDAKLGEYTIEVAQGTVKTTVMVTVTGPAAMIDIACAPDPVPAASGLTACDVTLTDANGNMPSGLDADDKIQVAVRDQNAQIIGADSLKQVNIDDKGMAGFSVLFGENAVQGTSITINVSTINVGDTTMTASAVVTYGMAQTPAPTTPAAPTEVSAASFPGSETIGVSWGAAPGNVAQYWVVVLDSNGFVVGDPTIVGKNDTTGRVTNVPAGDYTVIVAAYYSGVGFKYDFNGVSVTVN